MSNFSNIKIFSDTAEMCESNGILKRSIENSVKNQKLFLENDIIPLKDSQLKKYPEGFETLVSTKRTFEAAMPYALKGKKVCALNFASARNPGGGVLGGATAQEEALCRISTLYFALSVNENMEKFYLPHRELNNLYNDDLIYTPNVTVFKSDSNNPVLKGVNDWFEVSVITCAAPNLRYNGRISDAKLQAVHEKRAKRILDTAAAFDSEVLILGAFGCGAFANNPEVVAPAYKNVLENYKNAFETVEFAIYARNKEDRNFKTFNCVFEK